MKAIPMFISILFFGYSSLAISQKSKSNDINMELLIGTWSPLDSVYTQMEFRYSCIEFTNNSVTTYECINSNDTNFSCPYILKKNAIRMVCHEKEQTHYKILKLTETELEVDIFNVDKNGRLKPIKKNQKYIRRN